jgi:serine phosphatase RsbU (regulator of sigma subunit)
VPQKDQLGGDRPANNAPEIGIGQYLRPETIDLRALVSHQVAVQVNDNVESVFKAFAEHGVEFVGVLDGARLVGLCSKHRISELLGGRYGFAVWARKPIASHLSPNETRISVTTPIGYVLSEVFARGDDAFYDDVLLVDEDESFLGLITTQTLFKVQNALMRTNIRDLIDKDREIERKNEQMETDLRMAMELQLALMPVTYPVFPAAAGLEAARIRFSHLYLPASLIGGDYFYIVRVSDSCAGIFICDVMGHGVRSALITSMLRALIEALGPEAADPGHLLTRLNAELTNILKQTGTVLFVTSLYCTLDWQSGRLRFSRAGHPWPIRIEDKSNQIEILTDSAARGGPALGLFPGTPYYTNDVLLSPNDRILLFTDGIIEADNPDGHEFGIGGLISSLRQNISHCDGDKLLASIEHDVRSFIGVNDFKDDVCLATVQWLPDVAAVSDRRLIGPASQ